ncbi:hypothetical protein ACFTQ7_05130 [Lysinibacillus sp. NPDC056959]|uniref:hypothetical protein n=1 Tax=Lysinibacillus sp. NPDC056959 TaxID=3345981 RepID=UPI0036336441
MFGYPLKRKHICIYLAAFRDGSLLLNEDKKALRFSHLYDGNTASQNVTRSLNTLNYEKIVEAIKNLPRKSSIVDFGSGEGKLSSLLAYVKGIDELLAVEPSKAAMKKAIKRFEGLADAFVTPKPTWGSLFYYDARFHDDHRFEWTRQQFQEWFMR